MRTRHVEIWAVGLALTTTMIAASVFQYVLGALAPALTGDLGMSHFELGGVIASYYFVAALASSTLGRRVHRLSTRAGAFVLYLLAASACAFAAAVATEWALFTAAFVAGVAAGLCNPVTNLVIAARPRPHGALVGTKQAGVQFAAVLMGVCMPALATPLGWRGAMVVLAAVLLLIGSAVAAAAPKDRLQSAGVAESGRLPAPVYWLCGYAFLMGAGMATLNTYLVLYGHDHVGMSAATAGLLLSTLGLSGAMVRVANSIVAEHSNRLGVWIVGCAAVAAVGVAVIAASSDPLGVWVGVVVVGVSGGAWNGVVMLAVLRACPQRLIGHATGVVLAGFFVGLSVAPPLFGAIVDATASYTLGWSLTVGFFSLGTGLAVCMHYSAPMGPPATGVSEDSESVSRAL